MKLNEEQIEAVDTIEGPLLVLAGAGSGKTRVVTLRIVKLLEMGVPATQILGLTFTNKAAGEMRSRVQHLTHSQVLICTFHSLGARILRESIAALSYSPDFTIYDSEDVDKILRSCLDDLGIKDKKAELKTYRSLISKAKNDLLEPDCVEEANEGFPQVYSLYQTKLKQCNALDFDDLLYLTARLFKEHPEVLEKYQKRWSFLLIDEYQDTNEAQYKIVRSLVEKTRNLCVVGDPDQSIYSWRGANINNILNFEKDYPGAKVIRLEQNYRSTSNILEAANELIAHNHNRYEKELWSDLGAGELIRVFSADDETAEARFVAEKVQQHHDQGVPLHEIVVFYRTNFQSRVFEDQLMLRRIPYTIVGGISFYQRREIKDILAFLRLVLSPTDYVSFARTINLPKRGIGETTIEKIHNGALKENLSLIAFCQGILEDHVEHGHLRLTSKQKEGLREYITIIRNLQKTAREAPLKDLVIDAISQSRYLEYLKEDRETFDDRKGNLDALITKAVEWEASHEKPSLATFLEELSLKSSADDNEETKDRINLMTIHNGKGLEFITAFVVGLEEDLFPHANSKGNQEAVEEERRLCYVGMTRAKQHLYLSFSKYRYMWGMARDQRPSRFLREIPSKFIEVIRSTRSSARAGSYSQGDKIFHKEFGVGIVRSVYEGAAGLTYKIFFMKHNQEKSILAKYAELSRI